MFCFNDLKLLRVDWISYSLDDRIARGNKPLQALWMFELLVSCFTISEIKKMIEMYYPQMKQFHINYLKLLSHNKQYPAARCSLSLGSLMYQYSSSQIIFPWIMQTSTCVFAQVLMCLMWWFCFWNWKQRDSRGRRSWLQILPIFWLQRNPFDDQTLSKMQRKTRKICLSVWQNWRMTILLSTNVKFTD